VSASTRRDATFGVVIVCWLLAVPLGGCRQWSGVYTPRHVATTESSPAKAAGDSTPAKLNTEAPEEAVVRAVLARETARVEGQDHSVWIRRVDSSDEDSLSRAYRWHYPDLDDLLSRPDDQRPDFRAYLSDSNPVVATHAAIALARKGDATGVEPLAGAVRAPRFPLAMRRAAAEALGALEDPSALESLRTLIAQYGRASPQKPSHYVPALHAELIRGLARHVEVKTDPEVLSALRSLSAEVRLEAIRAVAHAPPGVLPQEAIDLRTDSDPQVRAEALRALARHRHPEAETYLAGALHDVNRQARLAAIASLGELGGAGAQAKLQELLETGGEIERAAAVAALATLGADRAVFEAAKDESWRVRAVVAEALPRYPNHQGNTLARELLDDPSLEVRRRVIAAMESWPLERAGAVLMVAMEDEGYLARKTASAALAARWKPAATFPIEGPPERRGEVLGRLRQRFIQEYGLIDEAVLARATSENTLPQTDPEKRARLERLLGQLAKGPTASSARQAAIEELQAFGPELVGLLERWVLEGHQPLPEIVYREVLPKHAPVFEVLDRLGAKDVSTRRRAASELIELTTDGPLKPLAGERLTQLVAAESDQLVWRSVLMVVASDPSERAMRLARAATGHPSPEIRRRGCEHLGAHPAPEHARILIPALEDANYPVVMAAVRALGKCGPLVDTQPLRRLLTRSNDPLRAEVALALALLGDPEGVAALERLGFSRDHDVRRRVAQAMGEIADPSFTSTLMRLLNDQQSVRQAALENLPKVAGRDVTQNDMSMNTTERIERWKAWYRQGKR